MIVIGLAIRLVLIRIMEQPDHSLMHVIDDGFYKKKE